MQRLDLKPDSLAEMTQATASEELTIEYDEAQAALQSPSALALLQRNEFILVLALLRQRQSWQETPGRIPVGLSVEALKELVKSSSRDSVERQLQRAALKVAALGIRIYPLHGERQYFVLFTSEVGKPSQTPSSASLPFTLVR